MINKISIFVLVIVASACSIFNKGPETAPTIYDFSNEITIDGLHGDLAVLAHDSLQGRETGTIGEKKAARYLAKRYREIGLDAVGDNNTYFQNYELVQTALNEISYRVINSTDNQVVDESVHSSESEGNFITLFGGSDALTGPVVFAGAGMVNEAEGINHFPEEVEGKWLMVFYSQQTTNMQALQTAFAEGALGAILVVGTDIADFQSEAVSGMSDFGEGGGLSLKYLQEENTGQSPAFNRVHPELAVRILEVENLTALEELQEKIIESPVSFQPRPLDFVVEHTPDLTENIVNTKNIVAFLEGSDPDLRNEVVVLSSHYDHVGVGRPDSTGDNIFNGADDDGSGTVATLHTAQAMMAAKEAGVGPKRSVLFLNVSGEEKGLLGSRYYSDHPIYEIDNTVANLNMDMIGRVDPEHESDSSYVYVIGGEIISSGLDSLTRIANAMGPNLDLSKRYNDLEDPNQFYRRSDHWNFGRLGVPFVFFFNGTHEDYHRQQDHVEKITWKPYHKRTQLVYNLTALLANSPERPLVDNQEFIEKTQVQPR
jgi:hypothetical protein